MQPLIKPGMVEQTAHQIAKFNRSVFSDLLWKEGDLFGNNMRMVTVVRALTRLLSQIPKDARQTETKNPVSDSQLEHLSQLKLDTEVATELAGSARKINADVVQKVISAVEAVNGLGSTPEVIISGLMFALSSLKYEDLEEMGEAWPSVQAAIADALLKGFLDSAPEYLKTAVPKEVSLQHLETISNLPAIIRAEGGDSLLESSARDLADKLWMIPVTIPDTTLIARSADVQAGHLTALTSAIWMMPKDTTRYLVGIIKNIVSQSSATVNGEGEGARLLRRLLILVDMSPTCRYELGRQALIDLIYMTVQPEMNAEFVEELAKLPCEILLTDADIRTFDRRLVRPPHVSKWTAPPAALWDSDDQECSVCLETIHGSDIARLRAYAAPQRISRRPKLEPMREANVDINHCGHYFHSE
ncbi:MAG: hypothetical protein KVP17_003648 [Porospora cf. gigantea B]|uniref:uncharacterized protein n=1 Tax=Porospora cf. gigantea B TaxID=2853592 RepID=UPI0035718A69|nr:MAG: hypothetical protein KVP17_003648 [Porospora cf. gigantea B]